MPHFAVRVLISNRPGVAACVADVLAMLIAKAWFSTTQHSGSIGVAASHRKKCAASRSSDRHGSFDSMKFQRFDIPLFTLICSIRLDSKNDAKIVVNSGSLIRLIISEFGLELEDVTGLFSIPSFSTGWASPTCSREMRNFQHWNPMFRETR